MPTTRYIFFAVLVAGLLQAGFANADVGGGFNMDRIAFQDRAPAERQGAGQPNQRGAAPPRSIENGSGNQQPAGRPLVDRLSEADQERLRQFITEYFPETAQELQRLIETRPRLAQRRLQRILPELIGLMRSRAEEPAPLFALKVAAVRNKFDIQRIEQAYRRANDDQRDKLAEALEDRVERAFDIRQEIGRLQIERLQYGIDDLQRRVDHHANHRAEIISHEMARRLNQNARALPPPGGAGIPGDPVQGGHRSVEGVLGRPSSIPNGNRPWPPDKNFIDQLPEEERRRVRAFIKEHFPDAARELRRQLEKNPRAGARSLRQLWAEMRRLMVSRESDPVPLFELKIRQVRIEMAMRRLQRTYRNAPERKRDRLRDELHDYLDRSIELRHEIGRMEIERLRRGLARLEERVERDTRERDELIGDELSRRLSDRRRRNRN